MLGYAFTWLKSNAALGGWDINVVTGGMPQKVATAMGEINEQLLGATYDPIAYLGKQVANGTNHAVLALQTVIYKESVKNIVIIKFNENGMDCNLYAIEPLIEGGPAFGGYAVEPKIGDAIDPEDIKAFEAVTSGWVGSAVHPVVLLATRVTKGTDLVFLATVTPVYPNAKATVKLVRVNALTKSIDFEDVL